MGELFEALAGGAGWGLGLGAALGAVALTGRVRPLAKAAVKLGLAAGTRVQEWTAETREELTDIVAEARTEQGGVAATAPADPTLVTPSGEPAASAPKRRPAATTAPAPVEQV